MKMNRVQFQRGLSMPEFFERYGTEAKCQAALQAARWPHGFVCPSCGGAARTSFVTRLRVDVDRLASINEVLLAEDAVLRAKLDDRRVVDLSSKIRKPMGA